MADWSAWLQNLEDRFGWRAQLTYSMRHGFEELPDGRIRMKRPPPFKAKRNG